MNLRGLPGVSRLFLDFIEDAPAVRPLLARHPDINSIMAAAREAGIRSMPRDQISRILEAQASQLGYGGPARENLRRLAAQDTVVVLTTCRSYFAGGPFHQFLKLLTAAKLAEELGSAGMPAIPVCWVNPGETTDPDTLSLRLLDPEGRLRVLTLDGQPIGSSHPYQAILEDIERLYGAAIQVGPLNMLRQSYASEADPTTATVRLLARFLEEFGILFLDGRNPDFLDLARRGRRLERATSARLSSLLRRQESHLRGLGYELAEWGGPSSAGDPVRFLWPAICAEILPVAAQVIGHRDVDHMALISSAAAELDLRVAGFWPSASVTVLDPRSKRILEKHGIHLSHLFEGSEGVLRKLACDDKADETQRRLEHLAFEIDAILSELKDSLSPEDGLAALVEDSRRRMDYQIKKLKERYMAATEVRRGVMHRQIDRVCNCLAPEGFPQELKLAGLHFVLRSSEAVFRIFYDKIDFRTIEHQLIPVE